MEESIYQKAKKFKKQFPKTIGWRLKSHCKVAQKYMNPGETADFVFVGQKTDSLLDFTSTYVIVLTDRRILLAQKRLLFGYFFVAITPDLFNDLKVNSGIIWSRIYIDTAKELIKLSKIDKAATDVIETAITEYMMEEKKKYGLNNN